MAVCESSLKVDTALMLLREEIDAIRSNPRRLYEWNAAPVDYRGLCHIYAEAISGKRSATESVFITSPMARILEECGFTLLLSCGLFFINWND